MFSREGYASTGQEEIIGSTAIYAPSKMVRRKAVLHYRSFLTQRVMIRRGYLYADHSFVTDPDGARLYIQTSNYVVFLRRTEAPSLAIGAVIFIRIGWE